MRDISRRLDKIEDKLHLHHEPDPRILKVFNSPEKELEKELPENATDWLTYQEKVKKQPDIDFVMLLSTEELYARGLLDSILIQEQKR
jgi:hypothetical protein